MGNQLYCAVTSTRWPGAEERPQVSAPPLRQTGSKPWVGAPEGLSLAHAVWTPLRKGHVKEQGQEQPQSRGVPWGLLRPAGTV